MGEIADFYADLAMLYEDKDYYAEHFDDEILTLYLKKKLYWTTKDNQKILVQKMQDSHLTNTINYLTRKDKIENNTAIREWLDVFDLEFNKRKLNLTISK